MRRRMATSRSLIDCAGFRSKATIESRASCGEKASEPETGLLIGSAVKEIIGIFRL
jgi:hypothetical protein